MPTHVRPASHALQHGKTLLHGAAVYNAAATAEVLIRHKANVDVRSRVGGHGGGGEGLALWIYRGHRVGLRLRIKGVIGGRMQGCDGVQSVAQWR